MRFVRQKGLKIFDISHLYISQGCYYTKHNEMLCCKIIEVQSTDINQHLERSKSQNSHQICNTQTDKKNCCDVLPFFLDEEEQTKTVCSNPNDSKDKVKAKQDSLKVG